MASLEKGKLDVFIGELRPDIAKNMMIRDNPSKTFLEVLNQTLRSETMRQRKAKDLELLVELALLALLLR